jgi:tetratricopeptide (TPR) repeat protein
VALEQGDAAGALLRCHESLALFREMGNTVGIAWALNDLGEVAVMQEDVAQATALLEEALELSREVAKPHIIAYALNGLGHTAQLVGDLARARQLHTESLRQFREYGEPNEFIPWAYQSLGQTALAQGDAALARQHFLEALRLFLDEGDRGAISFCLGGLAGAAVLDEDPERAAQLWGAAEALRQSIGTRQPPAARATRERLMSVARQQLGAVAFETAWTAGQILSPEQAIELALQNSAAG